MENASNLHFKSTLLGRP